MSGLEIAKAMMNVALDTNFAIPGSPGFPLNQAFEAPKSKHDAETLRQYMVQMRQELAQRLLVRMYGDGNVPSKVCLAFDNEPVLQQMYRYDEGHCSDVVYSGG